MPARIYNRAVKGIRALENVPCVTVEGGPLTCLRRREEKSPEGIFLTKAGAGQTHSGVNVCKGEWKMASEEMNGPYPRSCVSVLICCTSCVPQRRAGLGQCKSDESYAARLKTQGFQVASQLPRSNFQFDRGTLVGFDSSSLSMFPPFPRAAAVSLTTQCLARRRGALE